MNMLSRNCFHNISWSEIKGRDIHLMFCENRVVCVANISNVKLTDTKKKTEKKTLGESRRSSVV